MTLKSKKAFFFDLHGVVYYDDENVVPGALQAIKVLQEKYEVYFITNDPARSRRQVQLRLTKFGLKVQRKHIITAASIAEDYIQQHYRKGTQITGMMSPHLKNNLKKQGFKLTDDGKKAKVAISGGIAYMTNKGLNQAMTAMNHGADFILVNPDLIVPTSKGPRVGSGAPAIILEKLTGKKATVIGKPSPIMFQLALKKAGLKAKDVAMVGDNLDTDIAGANKAGLYSILVLTGLTKKPSRKANLTVKNLKELVKLV
ncbi:MAG: HAD-IIA family hydrolase [Candidatus Diapherotrites archaeon]|nr:HAD-IIA family hydrolase [Candidatus Diapherotrites archaeon]